MPQTPPVPPSPRLRDYVAWHDAYRDPASELSVRLRHVQQGISAEFDVRPGTVRVMSSCAGQGHDVLGVLAARPELYNRVRGTLLEINPVNAAIARERWRSMRGRTGVLHSGHALVRVHDGAEAQGVSSTTVRFGSPADAEIDAYVATGEPLGCAGAFTIDGLGGAFIDGIDGDPHGVVGISLPLLRRLLAELDVTWTDLWTRT